METLPRYLQYGEQTSFTTHDRIFAAGDPVGEKPVFYIIAGLVKVEYFTTGGTLKPLSVGGPGSSLFLARDLFVKY